jgi:hypothetical protein
MRTAFVSILMATMIATLWTASPVFGQEAPPPAGSEDPRAGDPELRQAMRQYFQTRLRVELGLTDEQAEEVLPKVGEMERVRRATAQERRRTLHELRRGYRNGVSDERLQELLGRIDRIEDRQREETRALMAEIDESLTARQQVEFRLFMSRFRKEMERRVRDFREDRADRPARRRAPRGPAPRGR